MSRKLTLDTILQRFRKVHGDKYDYSKVEYKSIDEKVCIICPEHGEFWMTPYHHINGCRCKSCSYHERGESQKLTLSEFIEKSKKIHGSKYDYSKVEYVNNSTKVCIICPKHGEFWQRPDKHLVGRGCPKCKAEKIREKRLSSTSEFIDKAKKLHGDNFDYSEVNYVNAITLVKLTCKKCGENFSITPNKLLSGFGCKHCYESRLETIMRKFLTDNHTEFTQEKNFCFIGGKRIDFFLPKQNIAIECQGMQHFEPVDYFGGETRFKIQVENDKLKKIQLEENSIKVFYIVDNNINVDSLDKDLYNAENTFHINDLDKLKKIL